jgi:protein-tyrosine phosphatase
LLTPPASAKDEAFTVPPDVSLHHVEKIDRNVYAGSKPHTDEDFQFLQSLHVHYIVSARFLPFLSSSEKRKAKRYGMTLLSFPMNASPIPPSKDHVDRILETLHDSQYQPVYLHCVLGRDRTGLIGGLYRIYYLGIPKNEAWQDMLQAGFHTWWFVRGLNVYFRDHADLADRP